MSKKIRLGKKIGHHKIELFGKTGDFPRDPMGRSAHITLFGNREVVIDGCYGIIEYSDCQIKVNVGNQVLSLTGSGFDISDYSCTAMTVRGRITGLEFC